MKAEVIQTIRDVGIIPVVRAQSASEAQLAIDAIREGAFRFSRSR
jgi:2-keto-3-deoxy-6-phosphogluconate aldolase